MIVFSRVSILSFSKIFWEKTDETYYYSFVAKERKEKPFEKLRSTNETGSNRIYFLRGKKSYQNMSDFYIRIFPRCFLITSETSTTDIYIYIFKYVKHFSFFLSFNLASQMEKRATKKDHRGILDLWPFFFSFSRIREFRSHRERATCPIWLTLDLRDTYFSRVVDLFSIYLIVQFFRKRAKSRIPFSRQGVNKNN